MLLLHCAPHATAHRPVLPHTAGNVATQGSVSSVHIAHNTCEFVDVDTDVCDLFCAVHHTWQHVNLTLLVLCQLGSLYRLEASDFNINQQSMSGSDLT